MSADRGLLDRMRNAQRNGSAGRGVLADRSAIARPENVFESVQAHLGRLLNTRRGESAAFPDLGLPALSDVGGTGDLEVLRREIESMIRKFEPRLTGVRVKYVEPDPESPLKIRFQISGRPVEVEERVTFHFETAVDDMVSAWRVRG